MKVIEPGHVYELPNLEHPGNQILTFIKRSSKAIDYGDTEHPGTNTQSVCRALIERTFYLDSIIPAPENMNVIYFLRMVIYEYEARAYLRKQQKLNKESGAHTEQDTNTHRDGYNVPFSEYEIEKLPLGEDGHILINERCLN